MAVALVAVATFANTLGGGFTLDDVPIVEKNPLLQSASRLPDL